MNFTWLKKHPLTHTLGRWVMHGVRAVRTVQNWFERHRVPPLLPFEKRELLLKLAKAHGVPAFIETGTYLGETAAFMAPHFSRIATFELSAEFAANARKNLAMHKHIEVIEGDSGETLPAFLPTLKTPALFWLDAHYSGGKSARGALDSPIGQEVFAVLNHPIKTHVIVVDDARDFLGLSGYPTIGHMRKLVEKSGTHMLRIHNDLLVIAPLS